MNKELSNTLNNFYIFYILDGKNHYERTCVVRYAAEERVNELKKQYSDAFFTLNELPKKYLY